MAITKNQTTLTQGHITDTQHKSVYGDLRQIAKQMAQDVMLALNAELDDIHFTGAAFRRAIESTTLRVMSHIDQSDERMGIYEEALPGFTVMAFKKADGPIQESTSPERNNLKNAHANGAGADGLVRDESAEYQAASMLAEHFLTKSKQSIISIEHDHVLIVMFPVADTKKHLKTLGLWGEISED
jgi:hypothetical protein